MSRGNNTTRKQTRLSEYLESAERIIVQALYEKELDNEDLSVVAYGADGAIWELKRIYLSDASQEEKGGKYKLACDTLRKVENLLDKDNPKSLKIDYKGILHHSISQVKSHAQELYFKETNCHYSFYETNIETNTRSDEIFQTEQEYESITLNTIQDTHTAISELLLTIDLKANTISTSSLKEEEAFNSLYDKLRSLLQREFLKGNDNLLSRTKVLFDSLYNKIKEIDFGLLIHVNDVNEEIEVSADLIHNITQARISRAKKIIHLTSEYLESDASTEYPNSENPISSTPSAIELSNWITTIDVKRGWKYLFDSEDDLNYFVRILIAYFEGAEIEVSKTVRTKKRTKTRFAVLLGEMHRKFSSHATLQNDTRFYQTVRTVECFSYSTDFQLYKDLTRG